MTQIRPFRALRYNPERVALEDVLAPVYDIVAPEDREALWERHPNNAVRLELTRSAADEAAADYSDTARRLSDWCAEGVLLRDKSPACYALRQRFKTPSGAAHTRIGFFAALRLEDYASRVVRPHERTLEGPKSDRMKLLRALGANTSSIFVLYQDEQRESEALLAAALEAAPGARAVDTAGVENELAVISDPEQIAALKAFMKTRPVVIADGHHRYETALAYAQQQREQREQRARHAVGDGGDGAQNPGVQVSTAQGPDAQNPNAQGPDAPADFVLCYFSSAHPENNLLLPIHRLVREGRMPDDAALEALAARGWRRHRVALGGPEAWRVQPALDQHLAPCAPDVAFALEDGDGALWIFQKPAGEELAVDVIHRELLEEVFGLDQQALREGAVAFPKSTEQAARDLRAGRGIAALYLNALLAEDVFRVTEAGRVMPQKSTYFAPKLPTGLLFRTFEDDS